MTPGITNRCFRTVSNIGHSYRTVENMQISVGGETYTLVTGNPDIGLLVLAPFRCAFLSIGLAVSSGTGVFFIEILRFLTMGTAIEHPSR